MSKPAPIQITATAPAAPTMTECMKAEMKKKRSPAMYYGVVFLIVLIVIFFVLWLMKPALVMKKDGDKITTEVDFIRVLIGAVIIALIITVLLWLVKAFMMKKN